MVATNSRRALVAIYLVAIYLVAIYLGAICSPTFGPPRRGRWKHDIGRAPIRPIASEQRREVEHSYFAPQILFRLELQVR